MNWREWVRQLLCRIYEIYGGDCAELGIVPNPAIWRTAELAQGPFPKLDEQGRNALSGAVDDLESHLAMEANDLEPMDNQMLEEMISHIRSELAAY